MTLRDALGDPDDVSAFLLFQLEEGVEDAEVELLHERIHVQFDLGTENKKKLKLILSKTNQLNRNLIQSPSTYAVGI